MKIKHKNHRLTTCGFYENRETVRGVIDHGMTNKALLKEHEDETCSAGSLSFSHAYHDT